MSRPALEPTQHPIPVGKAAGREADHSPPSSAKLYLHTHYIFMAWCFVKRRDNFTFLLSPYFRSKKSITEFHFRLPSKQSLILLSPQKNFTPTIQHSDASYVVVIIHPVHQRKLM
jgi:hypothetical protein